MRNFKRNLQIALCASLFVVTATVAQQAKTNRLETRLLVQTLMQDAMLKDLSINPEKTKQSVYL